MTKSAAALFVDPNTIVYRLRRIREVCGRDPHDPNDLLLLTLALKLADLQS
jgi:DNA-binding PucR family transcriptional regulator